MRLIAIHAAGWTLGRFVFASAVRIALSTTFSTPQPTVALQAAIDPSAPLSAPAAFSVEPAENKGSAGGRDNPALTPDLFWNPTWALMGLTTGHTVRK
jgi:hypothetical protein